MNRFKILIMMMLIIGLASCDDTIDTLPSVSFSVEIKLPDGDSDKVIKRESIELKNVSTGEITKYSSRKNISAMPGLYDISYDAELDGEDQHIMAYKASVVLSASSNVIDLDGYVSLMNDDFIISEVFFTGTQQASGNYYGDDYVKIYNNTNRVLYADGLTLFESKFTTTQKYVYTPDIMHEAMTVQALYTIPGSGKDYPIQPGEYILLADNGMNHKVANPNSFDLSQANWEWYDVSSQPSHLDIDNPAVPNLDKWYCYTLSFWTLHNRGFKAYGIARIPIDKEEYLKNYLYTYNYTMITAAGTFPMKQSAYKLPNKWIVDVVNCSVASDFAWIVTDPSLDMGWTHCGSIDHDKTRFFHSVRRKMLYLNSDGNPILKDTNNSTNDFNPDCIPSEIERQGTAIDIFGNKPTSVTYDGVIPIK